MKTPPPIAERPQQKMVRFRSKDFLRQARKEWLAIWPGHESDEVIGPAPYRHRGYYLGGILYRRLKAYEVLASPAFIVMRPRMRFTPTSEGRQTCC
jgi:hypothetical protein